MFTDKDKPEVELRVSGNKVVNGSGKAVSLAGVNIPSMEWLIEGENMVRSTQEAFDVWNCNTVRIPLNQDFWFGYGPGQNGGSTGQRNVLNMVIQEAERRNKYVIIDLHWSDRGVWGTDYGQQRMPDDNSAAFWQSICGLYGNNPHVLFGLYNEPHDIPWEQWRNGGMIADKTTYHSPGLQGLVHVVREAGARNICIAGGLDWAYDLTGIGEGFALADKSADGSFTGNGIIYDAHVYPFKKQWDVYVECIKDQYPILIGECGWFDPKWYRDNIDADWHAENHTIWCPKLLDWIERNHFHWTAWCFHTKADPNLLSDWNYTPSPEWGEYAKAGLSRNRG